MKFSEANLKGIFITGTDTEIGKTTISAALILALQHQGLSIHPIKPVETGMNSGHVGNSDTERLRQVTTPSPTADSVCVYAFDEPLAPWTCSQKTGIPIDIPRIISHIREHSSNGKFLVVEGSGGILTPLTRKHTIRDLIITMEFPCLIVGKTSLGGVNHALLSIEALQKRDISVCGMVLNSGNSKGESSLITQQRQATVDLLKERCPVPVFGPFPYEATLAAQWHQGIDRLAKQDEMVRLTRHLLDTVPSTA